MNNQQMATNGKQNASKLSNLVVGSPQRPANKQRLIDNSSTNNYYMETGTTMAGSVPVSPRETTSNDNVGTTTNMLPSPRRHEL